MIDEKHPIIKPRRVTFGWTQTPLHWIPGEPTATHFINSLHLMLPAGERWFVQVYKDALPLIKDDRLRDEVKGFMGQEATHARSHQGVLDNLLETNGIDHTRLTAFPDRFVAKRPSRRAMLPRRVQRPLLIFEIALIAAIEHYTAVLGQWVLDADALDRAGADPIMLDLLRWHGAEEVEHRSVAFDVYRHLSDSRTLRTVTMLMAVVALAVGGFVGTGFLLRADPTLPGKRLRLRNVRRAMRKGLLPTFGEFFGAAPRYLRADYHPSKECSTQKAIDYLGRSPAAIAAGGYPSPATGGATNP